MAWLYKKDLVTPSLSALISTKDDFFSIEELHSLSQWPSFVTAGIWYTGLMGWPLLPLIFSSDIFVSDKQRGTLRFFLLRTNRRSFLLGRFLGQVLILGIFMSIAMCMTMLHLNAWGSPQLAAEVKVLTISGLNFIVLMLPTLALITLTSTFASTPRRVMVWSVLLWCMGAWLVAKIGGINPSLSWVKYVLPGSQVSQYLTLHGFETLKLAPISIAQALFFLFIADRKLSRGDL